jgi:hypothetical protein
MFKPSRVIDFENNPYDSDEEMVEVLMVANPDENGGLSSLPQAATTVVIPGISIPPEMATASSSYQTIEEGGQVGDLIGEFQPSEVECIVDFGMTPRTAAKVQEEDEQRVIRTTSTTDQTTMDEGKVLFVSSQEEEEMQVPILEDSEEAEVC